MPGSHPGKVALNPSMCRGELSTHEEGEDKMKPNLETLTEIIEDMPIYGELRKKNKLLTFGQYLTVLKTWFDKLRKEREGFEKELREKAFTIHWHHGTEQMQVIELKEILGVTK